MFDELHDVGVRYGFDIYIENDNIITVKVPAWIGVLPDYKAAPILHDLNRALLNLKQNSQKGVVLNTYV